MKKIFKLGACVSLVCVFIINEGSVKELRYVTSQCRGVARMGDQLIAYLHAKWISYKFSIPLLFKPFQYSEFFNCNFDEEHYSTNKLAQRMSPKIFRYRNKLEKFIDPLETVVYLIPYFPESLEEHRPLDPGQNKHRKRDNKWPYFAVDWKDPGFKKEIQKMLSPKNPVNVIKPPKNGKISVALHVRKPTPNFDDPLLTDASESNFDPDFVYLDVMNPFKTVCDDYYIEQIKTMLNIFPDKELYIFLFTDYPYLYNLIQKYKNAVNNDKVEWACRKDGVDNLQNPLEDFYSLMEFDCLIRSDSNFALTASKIHDFKICISPKHHYWEGRKLVIDEVEIEKNC